MAVFCHFWRIAPAEYWALSGHERNVMVEYQNEYIRREQAAARRRH